MGISVPWEWSTQHPGPITAPSHLRWQLRCEAIRPRWGRCRSPSSLKAAWSSLLTGASLSCVTALREVQNDGGVQQVFILHLQLLSVQLWCNYPGSFLSWAVLLSNIADILSLSSFQGTRDRRSSQGQILMQKGKAFVNPFPTSGHLTWQRFDVFIRAAATDCPSPGNGRTSGIKHLFPAFL